jgi:hypothetical protein
MPFAPAPDPGAMARRDQSRHRPRPAAGDDRRCQRQSLPGRLLAYPQRGHASLRRASPESEGARSRGRSSFLKKVRKTQTISPVMSTGERDRPSCSIATRSPLLARRSAAAGSPCFRDHLRSIEAVGATRPVRRSIESIGRRDGTGTPRRVLAWQAECHPRGGIDQEPREARTADSQQAFGQSLIGLVDDKSAMALGALNARVILGLGQSPEQLGSGWI